jgi:purine-nucleoside phosphorylase
MSASAPFSPFGIVSGSGIELETMFDSIDERLPFHETGYLPDGSVEGHDRCFLRGRWNGIQIVIQCGRLHMYEGFDYATVTRPLEQLHAWGVRTLFLTNAAGGLVAGMAPGDLVAVERVRMWRYAGWPVTPGMAYTDFMVEGCAFGGSYQWMHGPCYETRAEIAALQQMQISAVGMSGAPELVRAQELGIATAMVACITNACCVRKILTHADVCAVARKSSDEIIRVLRNAIMARLAGGPL